MKNYMDVLWPPPTAGDRITLACGCEGTVRWCVPVGFAYRVQIAEKSDACARHALSEGLFTSLENVVARQPRVAGVAEPAL